MNRRDWAGKNMRWCRYPWGMVWAGLVLLFSGCCCPAGPTAPRESSEDPAFVPDPGEPPGAGGESSGVAEQPLATVENKGMVSGSEGSGSPSRSPRKPMIPAPSVHEEVDVLLALVLDRQTCNRLNECPPGKQLAQRGIAAVEPVIRAYRTLSQPTYQRVELVRILGHAGSPQAKAFLLEIVHGPSWEERMEAAVALARLDAREYIPLLRGRLQEEERLGTLGVVMGIRCALAALGDGEEQQVLLKELRALQQVQINAWQIRFVVECFRELQETELCALLPEWLAHPDLYLRRSAMDAAGELLCTQEPVLRLLAANMDDRVPSVRQRAQAALHTLTGIRFQSHDAFQDYLIFKGISP